jgi:hypothetical protein
MPNSFWRYQVGIFWKSLAGPLLKKARSSMRFSAEILVRRRNASACPIVGLACDESEKLTVIVLNHKRPRNVSLIAEQILRAGFVARLVVSNNSQDYPIEKYVTLKDARLVLLDQNEPSGVGIRFELAKKYPARYYVCVDDDIFLHPAQLQWIYWSLREAEDRPHGIFGAALAPDEAVDKQWPFVHRRNRTSAVDILNGLFAFTREHLEEYFRLCALLGVRESKTLMNGEDIILSFAGSRKPCIHNVGPVWECASASSPGIALYMSRPRFYEERWRIFSELRSRKRLDDTPTPELGQAVAAT